MLGAGEREGELPGKVTQVVPMYGTTRKLPHNGDAARNRVSHRLPCSQTGSAWGSLGYLRTPQVTLRNRCADQNEHPLLSHPTVSISVR